MLRRRRRQTFFCGVKASRLMPLSVVELCVDFDVISSASLSNPNDLSRSSMQIATESTSISTASSAQTQQNINKYNHRTALSEQWLHHHLFSNIPVTYLKECYGPHRYLCPLGTHHDFCCQPNLSFPRQCEYSKFCVCPFSHENLEFWELGVKHPQRLHGLRQ